jgi:uncharacterized protein
MIQKNEMKRRHFLKNSVLGVVGAGIAVSGDTGYSQETKTQNQPQAQVPQTAKIKAFRTLGRTGFKVSDIGSGGPRNEAVLNTLLDAGVNYIDTAESYGRGKSEIATGNVIKNRDRKSLFITTKLVMKKDDTKESILKRTGECLARMQTGYVDCLMMHNVPKAEDLKFQPFHDAVKQLKSEGKLRFVGMSNHGSQYGGEGESMENVCLAAAADGRFDVMLFVYNFVQDKMGENILKACKEKNIGVTLMKTNPVGGYQEFETELEEMKKAKKEIPQNFLDAFATLKERVALAQVFIKKYNLKNPVEIREAAVKFVLGHPDVATVCCSFESFDDVDSYIKLSGTSITSEEKKKLSMFKQGCGSLYCRHACGICESRCPHHVPVNTIMRYNHYFEAQGREKHAMQKYAILPMAKADKCFDCPGFCESACPYEVPVHSLLAFAHRRLTLIDTV